MFHAVRASTRDGAERGRAGRGDATWNTTKSFGVNRSGVGPGWEPRREASQGGAEQGHRGQQVRKTGRGNVAQRGLGFGTVDASYGSRHPRLPSVLRSDVEGGRPAGIRLKPPSNDLARIS